MATDPKEAARVEAAKILADKSYAEKFGGPAEGDFYEAYTSAHTEATLGSSPPPRGGPSAYVVDYETVGDKTYVKYKPGDTGAPSPHAVASQSAQRAHSLQKAQAEAAIHRRSLQNAYAEVAGIKQLLTEKIGEGDRRHLRKRLQNLEEGSIPHHQAAFDDAARRSREMGLTPTQRVAPVAGQKPSRAFEDFLRKFKRLPGIGTAVGAGLITSDVQAAFDRGGEEEAAKVMAIELARMGDPGFELAWDVASGLASVAPGAAKEIMSAIAPKLPPEKRAQFAGEDYVGATDVERKRQEEVGPTP